jgi:hypothetical protein
VNDACDGKTEEEARQKQRDSALLWFALATDGIETETMLCSVSYGVLSPLFTTFPAYLRCICDFCFCVLNDCFRILF